MTQELMRALQQIVQAKGPIQYEHGTGEFKFQSHPDYPIREQAHTTGLAYMWKPEDAAMLIHALKLDIRARACTVDSYEYKSGLIEVTITSPEPFKAQMHSVTEMHKDEGTAHALAWLSAFGGKE